MIQFCLSIILLVLASYVELDITAVNSLNRTDVFYDMELKFIRDIQGVMVLADPEDGCSNITGPPPELSKTSTNCFVLIEGSTENCDFNEKVKHAIEAKYAAAVIYYPGNSRIDGAFETQKLISFWSSNITSLLISLNSGNTIKANYLYEIDRGSRIYIIANAPNIITMLLIFAVAAGIFIVLMFLFLLGKCVQQYRLRNRYRISQRHLKQLPTEKYKSDGPYETCAICLEDYKEKDSLRILPCSHAYHCKCIDPWLTNNRRTCPVCKQKVSLAGVHDDDDSASDTEGRAETAPLIPGAQRQPGHGTFAAPVPVSFPSTSSMFRVGSGEGTSRDAPSEALDEISEELEPAGFRASSSAPDVLVRSGSAVVDHGLSEAANPEMHVRSAAGAVEIDVHSPSSSLKEEKTVLIV